MILKKKISMLLPVMLLATGMVYGQSEAEKGLEAITESAVRGQLEFLASDWTEGRAVGTKGGYMAADYIASILKIYGVEPFGDVEQRTPTRSERSAGLLPSQEKTYFQNFTLLEYSPGEEQNLSVVTHSPGRESAADFTFKTDFDVTPGTVGRSGKAPLVFAGYGFKEENGKYNDLAQVDVKGKIAVIVSGFPGHKDAESEGSKKFTPQGRYALYYLERNKTDLLSKAGALAIIKISTTADPSLAWAQNQIYPVKGDYFEADESFPSYYDTRMTLPGDSLAADIPVFTVSARVGSEILSGSGLNLETFEKTVAEKMQPLSRGLAGKSVSFKTTVNSQIVKARNVVGMIEGEKKDEFIVVGGHYDHVGKWNGWIWNGADDNASGTVGVMTIAKAFKATGKKPEKTVIFAAWDGEEKGLWGSRYFVREAMKQQMNIVLKLNYDMIARDTENDTMKNKASMVYTKANAGIEKITRQHIEDYNINLDLAYRASERPSGGSDHAPFAQENIPIFYFMAAMHPDYHLPSDELSKINWEKMVNIIKIGFLNTWNFANSNEFLAPEGITLEN
jgi:Zn-dependent M28 family amino/carboxypeptidase